MYISFRLFCVLVILGFIAYHIFVFFKKIKLAKQALIAKHTFEKLDIQTQERLLSFVDSYERDISFPGDRHIFMERQKFLVIANAMILFKINPKVGRIFSSYQDWEYVKVPHKELLSCEAIRIAQNQLEKEKGIFVELD